MEPVAAQTNIAKFKRFAIDSALPDCLDGRNVRALPPRKIPAGPAITDAIVAEVGVSLTLISIAK